MKLQNVIFTELCLLPFNTSVETLNFFPGYFKYLDNCGKENYGIFMNSVIVRNGELINANRLKYDSLKKCFSGKMFFFC